MRFWPLLLILGAFLVLQNRVEIRAWIDPPSPLPGTAEVLLYATEWCGYCARARAMLDTRGVSYREYDVEKSATGRTQFAQLGGRGVPVVVIGEKVIHGFNKHAIDEALRLLVAQTTLPVR
jgi:glutaredoxin-like YruB-family protein